jgi:gamma-tubulin complex component 2
MSTSHPRSAAYTERRQASGSQEPSARPRPSQDRRRALSPQPSTNSGPQSRATSGTFRDNVTYDNFEERRAERTRVTTKEGFAIRNKSPTKQYASENVRRKRAQDGDRTKPGSRAGIESSTGTRKGTPPLPASPWNPQASLIPHTSAPLACRVSAPPLASKAPPSLQPPPLEQLSPDVQEAVVLEDLLFVFMGYEGQYIRFVDSYDPSNEKDRLAGPSFRILKGLDPSLRDLTTTMLQMAKHYGAAESFVEVQSREEFGAVNHALCAAIRKLLKDYLMLIAQLEHQFLTNPSFTLHVLHLHTLPTSHMLLHLYSLAHEILRKNSMLEEDLEDAADDFDDVENILESLREGGDLAPGSMPGKKICKGGTVLDLLTKRLGVMSGDPAARSLLTALLKEASRPYMAMLNEWLHHGGIKDPHGEFLIREQQSIRRERLEEDYTDEYWEKRYTIREHDVPPQLEGVREKVLLAGKYLNVVRECGGVDASIEVQDVPKTFDDVRFLDNVNGAYAHANSSLLNLLLTTHALPARLRSLKHYFFLDRSDFFSSFLELSASELRKPARAVNVNKLQSLLDLVLRQPGSVAAEDPFKEDVKVQMNEVGLTKWLMRVVSVSGIDQDGGTADGLDRYQTPATSSAPTEDEKHILGINALELDYSVPFPLSLVISRKTVLRYQLLFRYLLSLRHLESQLAGAWNEHSRAASWKHQSSDPKLEMWKRRAWTLRARMLVFVQQLLYFCTAEVIEPNWQGLMARLKEKEGTTEGDRTVDRTVDELMQDHVDFLDTCLKECMLTNSKLLKVSHFPPPRYICSHSF